MAEYVVRMISVYATHWRFSGTASQFSESEIDLGAQLRRFYNFFEDQLPRVLFQQRLEAARLTVGPDPNTGERLDSLIAVETVQLLVFALPFPADQVVAALILDYLSPDLNSDPTATELLLSHCADANTSIDGEPLADYIDRLTNRPGASRIVAPGTADMATGLPMERHQLIFIGDLRGQSPPTDDTINQLAYRIRPPYRAQFITVKKPDGLNVQEGAGGFVTRDLSFLYGHPDDVENSVFLTTVQAVGTASRFRQIWQDAYFQVRDFQSSGRQAKKAGLQQRKDLEKLADEMGNLELDLAFSVETAAELGLRLPFATIDSFHQDLYDVMQIHNRARTVSQMFLRLGGSIRSELTAIESRERQQEDARRLRGARALGVLTFLAVPITFFLGFFGMNAREVHGTESMWNHSYIWVYVATGLLALTPVMAFLYLYGLGLIRAVRDPSSQGASDAGQVRSADATGQQWLDIPLVPSTPSAGAAADGAHGGEPVRLND